MTEFWKRLWFGALFVLIMVTGVMWSEISTLILFSFIVFLASMEMQALSGQRRSIPAACLQGMLFLVLSHGVFFRIPAWIQVIFALTAWIYPFIESKDSRAITSSLLNTCLISLPFVLLTFIPSAEDVRFTLLAFFILIWANDTFAYLAGKQFGQRKLWERISPKKTWEGFLGGIIFAMLFSMLLSGYCAWSRWDGVFIALIISISGTVGDLLESSMKRKAGVKDSGNIIPGHGGILDRFDAVMLSAPAVFLYLWCNDLIDLTSSP